TNMLSRKNKLEIPVIHGRLRSDQSPAEPIAKGYFDASQLTGPRPTREARPRRTGTGGSPTHSKAESDRAGIRRSGGRACTVRSTCAVPCGGGSPSGRLR